MKSLPAQRPRRGNKTKLEQLHATAKRNEAVRRLLFQCKAAGIKKPVGEWRFHPNRRWKADLIFNYELLVAPVISRALIVEVDGGLYIDGAHSRGQGRERDYERDAEAMKLGYRVLRVSPRQVKSGQALQWIQELLK